MPGYSDKILAGWSIPRKLLLLLLVIFLPASGIIISSGLSNRKHEILEAEKDAHLLVQNLAAQQEQIAGATKQMLGTLAQLPQVQRLEAGECNELFRQVQKQHPFYSIILAATPDGNVFAASTPFEPESMNVSDRKYIGDVIKTRDFSTGEYITGRLSRTHSLHYAYPVLDANGDLVAIVAAGFKLAEFFQFISQANLPDDSAVTFLDHRGVRLYRYPENAATAPGVFVGDEAFRKISGDLDNGTFERTSEDGTHRIYAFKQLRLGKGSAPYLYISIGIPKGPIINKADSTLLLDLMILSIAAFIAIFLVWRFANRVFIEPMNKLVETARRFGKGDMAARTGLPSMPGELGQLAHAFDEMASLLQARDTELNLRQSYLVAIIENQPGLVWLKDLESRFLAVNEVFARFCRGTSPEKIVGKSDLDVWPRELAEKHIADDRRVIGEAVPIVVEGPISGPDGVKVFETYKTPVIDKNGMVIGTSGFALDITERKRIENALRASEELFRLLVENAPDAIFVQTEEHFAYVNPATVNLFGAASPQRIIGTSVFERIHPFYHRRARERIHKINVLKEQVANSEQKYVRLDGTVVDVETSAVPITYEGLDGALVFVRDISERKWAEEERERLEAKLSQAQKLEAVGTLAGGIAHDFNNILSPIIGYTELALSGLSKSDPLRNGLEQVFNAALRAKDLVQQILAFSRLGQEQKRVPLQVSAVIKEALKFLRASLPATIEIRQDIRDGVALADATQVHQVMMNLCTNAAHAMDGRGILDVGLSGINLDENDLVSLAIVGLKPGPYLKLSVSDTGCGMDAATVGRIFDPYFTTKEVGKGSGLGLAVVHGIVKRHEGAVTVKSEPGKGSAFSIYLPKLETKPDASIAPANVLPAGTERILLIDDEEAVIDISAKVLQRLGYRTTALTSSLHALDIFRSRSNDFDLIITDYTMPGLTGTDLAGEVLKIRPDMPIILCTGFSERATEQTAMEIGITGFLMKPWNMKQVAELIRRVLNAKAAA